MILAFLDELVKLGAVSDAHAQHSLERLDALERNKPTAGQLGRYSAIGAVAAPAIGAIGNVVRGRSPFEGATRGAKFRDAASMAVRGGLSAGAIPLARVHSDRKAEMGTLKKYVKENAPVAPDKVAFAASMYSAPLNPTIHSGASDVPSFKAPQLRRALQKSAEGAPAVGGFAMASDVPAFKSPNLRAGLQKGSEGLPDGVTYNDGDFKPVRFTKRGAAGLTPAGRLAQTKAVGMPRVTAPPGPSIADIAKPKGPGFGTGIAGAFKTTIGGTAGSQYK